MNNKGTLEGWLGLGVIIIMTLLFVFFFGYWLVYSNTFGEEVITVKEKWVKYHGDDAKYLVSSVDGQVFEISDNLIAWRWNSSDLYAYVMPGMNCSVRVQGWRFPFFSDYKNILEANCDG